MSSIIRQYRCSEVIIIIRVKAPPIKWYNQHMNSAIVVAYYNKPSQKQQLLRNNFFPCITNLNEDSTTAILKNFGQRNLPPPNCLYSQQLYIETTSTQNTA